MFFYFILGMLFCQFILPIVDEITSLILTWMEVRKSKMSIQLTQNSKTIEDINSPELPIASHQIGFTLPDDNPEEVSQIDDY